MTSQPSEIVDIAARVARAELDLVVGCRMLVSRFASLDTATRSHPAVLTIQGFESETDCFPLGAARDRWDAARLDELDRERAEHSARCDASIRAACQEIVALLG
jgi:hypothetical protein